MAIVGVATEEVKAGDPVKVNTGGHITLVTTPNGNHDGFFYNAWSGKESGILSHPKDHMKKVVREYNRIGEIIPKAKTGSWTNFAYPYPSNLTPDMGGSYDLGNSYVPWTTDNVWDNAVKGGVIEPKEAKQFIRDYQGLHLAAIEELEYRKFKPKTGEIVTKPKKVNYKDIEAVDTLNIMSSVYGLESAGSLPVENMAKTIPVPNLVLNMNSAWFRNKKHTGEIVTKDYIENGENDYIHNYDDDDDDY